MEPWIAAALLAVVLSSGCTTRRGSLKWTAAGVAMAVAGGLLLHDMRHDEEVPAPLLLFSAGLLFGGGGIAVLSGLNAIFDFSGPVFAEDPPARVSPAEREACLQKRRAISRHASGIPDLTERARVLQTMPDCGATSPPRAPSATAPSGP